jgi:hypothetical protein
MEAVPMGKEQGKAQTDRIAPDGVHLFFLAVIPADIERPVGKIRRALAYRAKCPLHFDLDGLIENY